MKMGVRQDFVKQLEKLKESLLEMGSLTEDAINKAVTALKTQDLELAQKIMEADDVIDEMELKIENDCLTLIATQQPMAKDLRRIATAFKIVTDLERIADYAVDIARITLNIGNEPLIKPLIDIPRMAEITQGMVRDALDAYVKEDAELGYKVAQDDDLVDKLHHQIFNELLLYMMEDPKKIPQATQLIFVSRYLERIADHATNVGEEVIYLVTAKRLELND